MVLKIQIQALPGFPLCSLGRRIPIRRGRGSVANEPAEQLEQTELPAAAYLPAVQSRQVELPAGEYLPTEQVPQPEYPAPPTTGTGLKIRL